MANLIQIPDNDRDSVVNMLCDDVAQSDVDRKRYLDDISSGRELYNAAQPRSNKPYETATEVAVPLLRIVRNQMVARWMRSLLGVTPIYQVETTLPAGNDVAAAFENAFQRMLVQIGFESLLESPLNAAAEDGTGVCVALWHRQYEPITRWRRDEVSTYLPGLPEPFVEFGQPYEVEEDSLVYDLPTLKWLPIEHCGTFPAAGQDIDTAPGVYWKSSMTGEQLRFGAESDDPIYDKAAVDKLEAYYNDHAYLNTADQEGKGVTSTSEPDGRFTARSFDIVEGYFRYAQGGQAVRDWIFTYHEPSRTLLRAHPRKVWFQSGRPIHTFRPFASKLGILGDSLGDLAGDFQRAQTQLLRLSIDAMELGINPELLIDAGLSPATMNALRKRRGPGSVLPIPNLSEVGDKIKPFVNGYVPTTALPLMQQVHQYGQLAQGFSDTLAGGVTQRQTTAHEVERMLQEGQELILLTVQRLARTLDRIAKSFVSLMYQHQGNESLVNLWQAANPGDQSDLFDVFQIPFDVTAQGPNAVSNRAERARMALERYQLFSQHPFVMAKPTRMWQLATETDNLVYGTRKPESVFGTEEEAMMLEQQQMLAQQQQAMLEQEMVNEAMMGEEPASEEEMVG